jgi:hypothetical protein
LMLEFSLYFAASLFSLSFCPNFLARFWDYLDIPTLSLSLLTNVLSDLKV